MNRIVRLLVVPLVCAVLVAGPARAQRPDTVSWEDLYEEPFYLDLEGDSSYAGYRVVDFDAARARWDEIGDEASAGGSPWAGRYDHVGPGDVGFTALRWAPGHGFVLASVYTCTPSLRRLGYGGVTETPAAVALTSSLSAGRSWPAGAPVRFLKVMWGGRRFLVAEEQIGDFCDYVAGLGAFNGSDVDSVGSKQFFVMTGPGPLPTEGLPVVPPGYERFVRSPVRVSIVAVGRPTVREGDGDGWNDVVTRVTVDAGRSAGVHKGMVFHLLGSTSDETVTIERVGRTTSEGVIVRFARAPGATASDDDADDPDDEPIRVGRRATTSVHEREASRPSSEEESPASN